MDYISEVRRKILKKNGHESAFVKLSVVAKVLGYSGSDPVLDVAEEQQIQVFRIKKYLTIRKSDLDRLLNAIIQNETP